MRARGHLAAIGVLLLLPLLFVLEGSSQITRRPGPAANMLAPKLVAERLHEIAAAGTLAELRWPNFTDYRQNAQKLYSTVNYVPVWIHAGQPSPQALAIIADLVSSQQRGLNPEDYDASR